MCLISVCFTYVSQGFILCFFGGGVGGGGGGILDLLHAKWLSPFKY